MTDVDEIRNPQIELHGLSKADGIYTFYHDETNNIRKLHIKKHGLNVAELKIFILGGIVHRGLPQQVDIQPLRQAMEILKSAKEIKLEHVAKGEFLDLLKSEKLNIFLNWLTENGLMIHYHDVDPLYWSIVDIIDSILPFINAEGLIPYHSLLKSDLNSVIRSDLSSAINLFLRYDYPGVAPENRHLFLKSLIDLIERNSIILPPFNAAMLKGVLQAGQELECLEFIEGFPANILIENFAHFYFNRIAVFKYSTHIMDMETSIQDIFLDMPLKSAGKPFKNYRFADSESEAGIQVSDIVVGLLGKLHTYMSQTSASKVKKDRADLTDISLKNALLLGNLIDASDNENKAFLHHVSSQHDIAKMDMFFHFSNGQYQ